LLPFKSNKEEHALAEMNSVIENAVKLFTELIAVQKQYAGKMKVPQFSFSEDEITRHNEAGEVFLNLRSPFYDAAVCSELREEICRVIKKHRMEMTSRIEEINNYLSENPGIFEEFLFKGRNLPSKDGIPNNDQELLGFMVYQTMRPLLQKYAAAIQSYLKPEEWLRDYCPVCGEKANFSYLRREDGKRVLICPLCGTEWLYRYLACSWCGNDNHKSIKYFEVTEIPAYEVYLCESCHGYLKTFNKKKGIDHEDWMLEDIKTLTLDMLALREGYTRTGQKLI